MAIKKSFRPGQWVSISRSYKHLQLENECSDTEKLVGLIAFRGDFLTHSWSDDSEYVVMVFALKDGAYLGSSEVDKTYIKPIKKPTKLSYVTFLPVAQIQIIPGFIDAGDGAHIHCLTGKSISKTLLVKQVARLNKVTRN